jgi:hypothetical protein
VEARERISSESTLWEIFREVRWKLSKPGVLELLSTIHLNKESGSSICTSFEYSENMCSRELYCNRDRSFEAPKFCSPRGSKHRIRTYLLALGHNPWSHEFGVRRKGDSA